MRVVDGVQGATTKHVVRAAVAALHLTAALPILQVKADSSALL